MTKAMRAPKAVPKPKPAPKAAPKAAPRAAPRAAPSNRESKGDALRLYADVATMAKVSVKDTKAVLDATRKLAAQELRMSNAFKLAALVSFKVLRKAAKPETIKLMFGQERTIPAKPARCIVKASALKQLKDAVTEG